MSLGKDSPIHLYTFAFITVSLSSGLVYGYPHLRNNLIDNGSTLTESQLGLVYTIGSWTVHGGRFFSGMARDRYGTKSIATACILSAMAGIFGLAFSNESDIISLSISFFLVGLGSGGQLCLQPVAGLFPKKWQGTLLASLSGAFQISGLVFLVLRQITEERKITYGYFSLLLGLISMYCLYVLPKDRFVKREEVDSIHDDNNTSNRDEENNKIDIGGEKDENVQSSTTVTNNEGSHDSSTEIDRKCHSLEGDNVIQEDETKIISEHLPEEIEANSHKAVDVEDDDSNHNSTSLRRIMKKKTNDVEDPEKQQSSTEKTALQLIKSTEYILLLVWFSIILIPQQYYIGTIAFQLERKGDDDGYYVSLFSILYAAAAFISPVLGKIADVCGLGLTQSLATILVSASLFMLNSSSLNVHVIGLACYGVGRMTVFGMFFTNVGKRFGFTHYGTLAGLGLLISAIFSLLQYPLIDAAANGYEYTVNLVSGFVLVGLCVPYCIWLGRKERIENT